MDKSDPFIHSDALYVRVAWPDGVGRKEEEVHQFEDSFRVGRADSCQLKIDNPSVSFRHTRFVVEKGQWSVRDLGSGEGTLINGERIRRTAIDLPVTVQLGNSGPQLYIKAEPEEEHDDEAPASTEVPASPSVEESTVEADADAASPPVRDTADDEEKASPSEKQAEEASFSSSHENESVHQWGQRRVWVAAAILLTLIGYSIWQSVVNYNLHHKLHAFRSRLEQQKIQTMRLQQVVEARGRADLKKQLAILAEKQQKLSHQYDGYTRELGISRKLGPKERAIHRVARIFDENGREIPAFFMRRVRNEIKEYWQEEGRSRFKKITQRAEKKGYTPYIVKTMREHDLPPEFFYLAMQESDFKTSAMGPRTKWGVAKGIWQFIPRTGRKYGLRMGPRYKERVIDPKDERQDFKKSTQAAADYLSYLYATRARASGLLVIASYNWGERHIMGEMKHMLSSSFVAKSDSGGTAASNEDDQLSYWNFLTVHRDRLPKETRDYVIKVFSSAVIGSNPHLFGFDMDNPLRKYMEVPQDTVSHIPTQNNQ